MISKPKSNKIKKKEKAERELLRQKRAAERRNTPSAKKKREVAYEKKMTASFALSRNEKKNPKEIIKALANDEKLTGLSSTSPFHAYKEIFQDCKPSDKKALCELLCHCVDEKVYFNKNHNLSNAVIGLTVFHEFWIRSLKDWKPKSYNVKRQFSSLARHLLAKYPVPTFMDNAFYTNSYIHQDWFIHVGSGQNIRTAPGLPVRLTKMEAHYMMNAPSDFGILEAIRWGQIKALGGDERLIRAFLRTRAGVVFTNNDFWISVIQWFMANPMLDTNLYAPITDYLNYQKFIPSVTNPDPNGPEFIPAQSNLSMKKRSVEATIKAMERWHAETSKVRKQKEILYWASSGILPFFYKEGNDKCYQINEILTLKHLLQEGVDMAHCVGSYAPSCASGRVSIWSLWEISEGKILTIEVDNTARTILQARGKYNVLPTHKASDIMKRWAASSGLTVSRWLI